MVGDNIRDEIIANLLKRIDELKPWKEAVIDALVISWVYQKEHESNPRKAINDLLAHEGSLALDPKVSEEAKALHDRIDELKEQVSERDSWMKSIVVENEAFCQKVEQQTLCIKELEQQADSGTLAWQCGYTAGHARG